MAQTSGHRARIPAYSFLCFAVDVCVQVLVYCGSGPIVARLTPHVLTGPLDAMIPFSPPWITVYLLCFPFWVITGLWVFSGEKRGAYRISAAYVLALLIACAMYLLWPGTMERPAVTGGGLFNELVRFVYRIDSPTNLCPSLHVLLTYFCLRGALGSGHIPRPYKVFCGAFFVLVCCCVLLVKQHALIDVPAAVLVAELSLLAAHRLRLERVYFAVEKAFRPHSSE